MVKIRKGGGLSTIYDRPSFQQGTGVVNSASNGMRQVPDVAGPADSQSGFIVIYTPPGEQQTTSGHGSSWADNAGCPADAYQDRSLS